MGKKSNRREKNRRKVGSSEEGQSEPTAATSGGGGNGDGGEHGPAIAMAAAGAAVAVSVPLATNLLQSTAASGTAAGGGGVLPSSLGPPNAIGGGGGGGGPGAGCGGWSWGRAFAAASAVRPDDDDLDGDFLRRTAAAPCSSSAENGGGEGGLAAIAKMAEEEAVASVSSSGKGMERAEESHQQEKQQQQQQQPPPPQQNRNNSVSVEEDDPRSGSEPTKKDKKNKRKKKKKKKKRKRKGDNDDDDEARVASSDRSFADAPPDGASKKQRRPPSPDDYRNDEYSSDGDDANDDGTDAPAQQALEGRMVPSDPTDPSSSQMMVLADSTAGVVYSATERTDSGEMVKVGALGVGGVVILDSGEVGAGDDDDDDDEGKEKGRTIISASSFSVLPASSEPAFPYPTEPDDHCESPRDSYEDIVPLLRRICDNGLDGGFNNFCKKKDASNLAIYDPYYCDGSVVRNLSDLGFPNVYNKKEDCYRVWSSSPSRDAYPTYDVLVTNPPYSGDHIQRLVEHVTSSPRVGNRPWFLLMPTWVHKKDYYTKALDAVGCKPFYLVPRKRYVYLPPKNFRAKKISDVHKKSSPFVSMWYVWAGSAERTSALASWWANSKGNDCRCDIARSRSALRDLRRKNK